MMMELDKLLHVVNVLVFCDHFMRHLMAYVTPDQMEKLLLSKGTSQSLEHQPSSWVTEEPTLRGTSSVSCASPWAFGRQEVCHTTFRLMDMWSKPTKCWCRWIGKWAKIRRQTSISINQNWCMFTTPQDQPSPDTAHSTWCLDEDHAYLLTFIFPPLQTQKNNSMLITMLLTYLNNCAKPSRKCKCSPHLRLRGRCDTMTIKLMPFHWNLVTWSWLKPMLTKGRGRWKTGERRNWMKWNAELLKASLPTSWRTSRPDAHESSTRIDFFSLP